MDKICVNLYGGKSLFGGKETPLTAETIYCDKTAKCTLYKRGKCLNVTGLASESCKFGTVTVTKGYTSRAKNYHAFQNRFKRDETYNKLSFPSNCKFAIIDDYVYVNVTFVKVTINEDNTYQITEAGFKSGASWIPISCFTVDLIHSLCSFRAHSLMGNEITGYRTQYIPEFLFQMRHDMPDLYNQFVQKYPEFDIVPNHVGKYARLLTINRDVPVTDSGGNQFFFEEDYLVCKNYKTAFMPFGAKTAEMRIKVTDDMKIKITNNDQVLQNTVFE